MGTIVELRPRAREEFTSSLGMLIFLGSWGMMFAALFFSYGFLRSQSTVWPPVGVPHLPIGLPALNTVVLLASSFTFSRGLGDLRRGRRGHLPWAVASTIALGTLFLVLQVVVWRQVWALGLEPSTGGLYGSVFYCLTAVHAAHVVAGLAVLLWVFVRSLRGAYTEHNHTNVRLCTLFWHFVDAMWVLMFVTVYLF